MPPASTSGRDRIFVQIASYRNPELVPTLRDCIAKARRPELLAFGIGWQHDENESLAEFAHDLRVRLFACDWRESRGACWARHHLQGLYDGEEFTLALDSHHRFEPGWDEILKAQLAAAPGAKPVLTAYVPPYQPDKGIISRTPMILTADRFTEDGALLFMPIGIRDHRLFAGPVRARFLSAHFTFSKGSFLADCRHDPRLYFHGEEITLSARAFTHGYDLFHPRRPVIYHYYLRDGRPKHWEDHRFVRGKDFGRSFSDAVSKMRVRALLDMEENGLGLGPYGLGSERSLADYEAFAGVDFKYRRIGGDAKCGIPPGRGLRDRIDRGVRHAVSLYTAIRRPGGTAA